MNVVPSVLCSKFCTQYGITTNRLLFPADVTCFIMISELAENKAWGVRTHMNHCDTTRIDLVSINAFIVVSGENVLQLFLLCCIHSDWKYLTWHTSLIWLNGLLLFSSKVRYNITKFITKSSSHSTLHIGYKENYTKDSEYKISGLQIDNHINWKNHVEEMILKLREHSMPLGRWSISVTGPYQ